MYMSEHNPPHFHPRRALRMVYEWLDQHQEELLANWERLDKSEEPMKIDPLQ